MAESAEQLRRMQILQMADLGTARREMISTAEFKNEPRTQLAEIESKRYLDQRDEAQLKKWANLHADIGDTRGMEELDDINCGQSHRANLHAMLHPNGNQPRTYANHPYPLPSAVRGDGVMGRRGRGGFVPLPSKGAAALPTGPTRFSHHATVSRRGRPGPRGRSTTMSASIHLDPALNCNNDDSDASERGRGRGRAKGKGRGNAQEQVHIPFAPSRAQRPPPAVNFASRISEPGDFMSVVQSRRATAMYKTPIDTTMSAIQMTASAQEPMSLNEPKAKVPMSSTPKKRTATALALSKPPVHVVPVDNTALFQPPKTQASPAKISQPHIGPYLVETPSPSHRVVLPGEQPRKKGAAPSGKEKVSSERTIPLTEVKKTPVTNTTQPKDSKRNVAPVSQKVKTKQKDQSQDLLSEDELPVNAVTKVFRPLKTVAIQSPGTAELAGLQFAEKSSQSIPAKSIDEVICPKTTDNGIPEAHSGRNDQSQEVIYGQQIIEELRDMREYIRSHQSLATRDIERLLEAKLLQLMPTVSSPTAESAASDINRLDDLTAPIESLSASHQRTNGVEVSSAARRDLTPLEGHRSPPPPSSSSNSPPSADKRAHKVCVPGFSPTRSESSDILSQFESLEVSDKLAPPLQPQRAIPTPATRPLEIPKRAATSDASVQVTPALGSRPKEVARKPLTLDDSIFAGPIGPATSTSKATEPNAMRSQMTTRALSVNHPNIPSRQGERVQSTGVRTIGPAPYKPRLIGPAPSVYEPTTLRDLPGARIRTVSVQQATMDTRAENRPSMNVASHAQSSGPASEQPAGRLFSMPDPATFLEPKVKTAGSIPTSRPRRQ
ncbi:Amino acid transporter transmembrane [Penicillium cf. griseofulvum]|nr:Amino acid transporter transmembrane [Penicillium cf. griseofulvum]